MNNEKEDRPYGADRASRHQVISKSDECDSRGGKTKQEQKVDLHAPGVIPQSESRKEKFDERLPQPKGTYPTGHRTTRVELGAKSKGPKNHLKEAGS